MFAGADGPVCLAGRALRVARVRASIPAACTSPDRVCLGPPFPPHGRHRLTEYLQRCDLVPLRKLSIKRPYLYQCDPFAVHILQIKHS
jgi:hypothetical protein